MPIALAALPLVSLAPLEQPQESTTASAAPRGGAGASTSTSCALADDLREGVRTLFLGNSLTGYNQLASIYEQLLTTARPPVVVHKLHASTPGNHLLAEHAARGRLPMSAPHMRWSHVVLQEQSWVTQLHSTGQPHCVSTRGREAHSAGCAGPGVELCACMVCVGIKCQSSRPYTFNESEAAFSELTAMGAAQGAKRIALFETWGYRDGAIINRSRVDYETIQSRVARGHSRLLAAARDAVQRTRLSSGRGPSHTEVRVAPVGEAWREAFNRARPEPGVGLGRHDASAALFNSLYADAHQSHPSLAGSYLAACVLAATLHGLHPSRLSFVPEPLDPSVAAVLREVASAALARETEGAASSWRDVRCAGGGAVVSGRARGEGVGFDRMGE